LLLEATARCDHSLIREDSAAPVNVSLVLAGEHQTHIHRLRWPLTPVREQPVALNLQLAMKPVRRVARKN